MADLLLDWNTDLSLTPSGDLALVDGDDFVRQRIIRRLFTAAQGYVFHLDYGAGMLQKIGGLFTPQQIEAVVRSQLILEDSVAKSPPARISVAWDKTAPGTQIILITYTDAPSGRQISLTISI